MKSDDFLRAWILRFLVVSLSFGLHGCGGGGPSANKVPKVVDRPRDVQSLVGGSPLNLSNAQIEAASARRIRQADRLHLESHDLDHFTGTISSNCRGIVCITRDVRISTRDLLEPPTEIAGIPIKSDSESSPVMTYRGIPIAQARGQVIAPSLPDASIDAVGLGGWLDYSAFLVSATAVFEEPRFRRVYRSGGHP